MAPEPACLGEVITFTASGVSDSGGIRRVFCSAKQAIEPGAIQYSWTLSIPPNYPPAIPLLGGTGPMTSVIAKVPGVYSATFTASTNRECPPLPISIGPETDVLVFSATVSADPTLISAWTQWAQTTLPWAVSELTVTWSPPECEGTLEIVEVVGDLGYVPPNPGTVEPLEPGKWIYRAWLEPKTELCPKAVNVKIGAMQGAVELNRVSVRVLPVHTWWITNHKHGPGMATHPPDTFHFEQDFDYLSWKYAGVLATSGGAFTSTSVSTDPQVVCGSTIGYACTSWGPLSGYTVEFGTTTFTGTENQAASIVGHELRHTAVGLLAGECPAYQWEADHAVQTGTAMCDLPYLETVNDYLSNPNNECP